MLLKQKSNIICFQKKTVRRQNMNTALSFLIHQNIFSDRNLPEKLLARLFFRIFHRVIGCLSNTPNYDWSMKIKRSLHTKAFRKSYRRLSKTSHILYRNISLSWYPAAALHREWSPDIKMPFPPPGRGN